MYLFTIILVISLLVLFYLKKNEHFAGNLYNLNPPNVRYKGMQKFLPINMIINPLKNNNLDNNLILNASDMRYILKNIDKSDNKGVYTELQKFLYVYGRGIKQDFIKKSKIDYLLNSLFMVIKSNIEKHLYDKKKNQCNDFNTCIIINKTNRILKVGKNKNNNIMLEGQMLVKLQYQSFEFLIRFVINDENRFTINYLRLEGFDFVNTYKNTPGDNYVNIYSTPVINKYNAQNTYLFDSDESNILESKTRINKIFDYRNKVSDNTYGCFGKNAPDKNTCESQYDLIGFKNKRIGIWDKICSRDTECPFYKKNKNYPNEFGGCIDGMCEMPVGVDNLSSRKHTSVKNAICYNCKDQPRCCIDQEDRKLYPNLKSPDYHFKNDKELRDRYLKDSKEV